MKSKKLISLLSAVAVASSAFAAFTITSSAAEPVWSYDATDSDASEWVQGNTSSDANKASVEKDDDGNSYIKITNAGRTSEVYMELPSAAQLSNDYVVEFDTAIHPGNGMGRLAQYNQVAVLADDAALDSNNYGDPYAAEATAAHPMTQEAGGAGSWSSDTAATGVGYMSGVAASITARLELAGKWIVNRQDIAPALTEGDFDGPDSEWMRVRAEVKDGKAKVTVATTQGKLVDGVEYDASTSPLSKISAVVARGDGNFVANDGAWGATGPGVVLLDNIKVYDGIANAPAFSTSDLRGEPAIVVIPEPETVAGAAPTIVAPERVEESMTADFESDEVGVKSEIVLSDSAPTEVAGGKMYTTAGERNSSGSSDSAPYSYAQVVNVANGTNAVKLTGGRFASGGWTNAAGVANGGLNDTRAPKLHLTDNIPVEEGETAVMAFATYLSKSNADGAKARLWLIDADRKDGVQASDINNSGGSTAFYKNVFALITAEDETVDPDDTFGSDNNKVVRVEPDKWHVITITVSAGDKYRLFVDGEYAGDDGRLAPVLNLETINYGDGVGYTPVNLPVLAIENVGSDVGSAQSKALIDNVVTYKIASENLVKEWLPIVGESEEPSEPTAEPTPTPTPTPKPTLQPAVTGITINPVAVGEAKVTLTGVEGKTAKLIHASYDANGVLTNVELKDAAAEVAITAAKAGDKIMVWNAVADTGMNPAAAVVEVPGAAADNSPVPSPADGSPAPSPAA